ncbi:glycosyltransferase family 71 protein [Backusella circina FSU 941]|nr:glycosyltransferase family 71 protein [Backusella circina FSU 941]
MLSKISSIRLISVALIICSILFISSYLIHIDQQKTLQFELDTQRAKEILIQQQQEEHLKSIELENQRLLQIEQNKTIHEPVITSQDEDMDELIKKYFIAVPTPIDPWTNTTLELFQSPLGAQLKADLFTIDEDIPNFKALTVRERVFKALYQYLDDGHTDDTTIWDLYTSLEDVLYPWIKPHWKHVFDINKNQQGRGIVMCVGNDYFGHAVTAITAIRNVLDSDLPIEIFYIDEYDLSEDKRNYFDSLDKVSTRPLVNAINDQYTQFGGWAMKPYAILASRFSEVLLMDADVFLFQKPDVLFEDAGYQTTGALFFLDRTLFPNWDVGRQWMNSFLPTKSSYVKESRWYLDTSAHEQESGIVVIDKRKALFGLLSTCKMNDKNERDKVAYERIHGDKETFWVGFEMVQTPYTFVRSYGAVIGGLGDAGNKDTVCGNQLHLDANQKPLWWNGGILRDKNRWSDRYLKFTHYAQGEDWQFETSCIKNKDKISKLSSKEQKLGALYIEIDKKRRNGELSTLLDEEE